MGFAAPVQWQVWFFLCSSTACVKVKLETSYGHYWHIKCFSFNGTAKLYLNNLQPNVTEMAFLLLWKIQRTLFIGTICVQSSSRWTAHMRLLDCPDHPVFLLFTLCCVDPISITQKGVWPSAYLSAHHMVEYALGIPDKTCNNYHARTQQ